MMVLLFLELPIYFSNPGKALRAVFYSMRLNLSIIKELNFDSPGRRVRGRCKRL